MLRRQQLPASLADREDLLSGKDLTDAGVSADGIRSLVGREITRLANDLFVADTAPSWEQHLAAGLQLGGQHAAAYRMTVLALDGLAPKAFPIEILTTTGEQPRHRSWVRFFRSDLPNRRFSETEIGRRVGIDDSVIDAMCRHDELQAIALVSRVLQERRTTPERLTAVIEGRRRVRHRPLLERILADAAGVESVLERIYDDRVAAPHDLPPMVRQFVVPETGHRADGAYVELRKLIELDGAGFHDPVADQELDNLHASFGWSTQRFGWKHCWVTPCTTARMVVGGEPPQRCRRCR